MRVIMVLLLLALAGCAQPAGNGTSSSPSPSVVEDLVVELDRGDGSEPERFTLVCTGVPEGDHPDPDAACAHLAGLDDPFAPLPPDAVCTEQYGGPETARITGRWQAEDVDLELDRTDGCHISQWESLGPVLPPVQGAVPD
jgi:hypothetical protein